MADNTHGWPHATTHAVAGGTCHKCFQLIYIGLTHHCPTALPWKDLSPLGGGPKP